MSAASFSGGSLAAESIATVMGAGLATSSGATDVAVIDSSGAARPVAMLYSSPSQLNFMLPAGLAAGPAAVVVTSGDGALTTSGGTRIEAVAPGIFSAASNGKGVAAGIARLIRADGSQSALTIFTCLAPGDCTAVPVDLGADDDVALLELYATGIRGRSSLDNVSCAIGGVPARVLYAGPQGQYAGLDQVNVVLPRALAGAGEVEIHLTADGRDANVVTVTVR